MILSIYCLVALNFKSYGTFCILKKLYNLYSGFTHYRNYRANISPVYFYATFGLAQLNRLLISQQQ